MLRHNVQVKKNHSCRDGATASWIVKQWDEQKADQFVKNLDEDSICKLDEKLNSMLQSEFVEQNDIDDVVQNIGEIFETSAKISFGFVKTHSRETNLKPKKQLWFTNDCRTARNNYHEVRKRYNKNKTEQNKNSLKIVSKIYKTTMSKALKNINVKELTKLEN